MTRHLVVTSFSLFALGYRNTRDIAGYVSRRLQRA
jgi:hypothetical protein